MCVCVCVCVCVCWCVYTCVYTCMCACVCVHMHLCGHPVHMYACCIVDKNTTYPLLVTICTEDDDLVVHFTDVMVTLNTSQVVPPKETCTAEELVPNPSPVISTACPPNNDLRTKELKHQVNTCVCTH